MEEDTKNIAGRSRAEVRASSNTRLRVEDSFNSPILLLTRDEALDITFKGINGATKA